MPARRKIPSHKAPSRKIRHTFPRYLSLGLPIILVLGFLFVAGGMLFAANQEEHDTFCASCHTQPESTFFGRTQASAPVDLASVHTTKNTKCIDCHSGPGTIGRVGAMMLGARNALAWFSHTAVQPAPLTFRISDSSCVKCHPSVTDPSNEQEHYHAFLTHWQTVDPQAATCVDCHASHSTDGTADTAFLGRQRTEAVCQGCHNRLGQD